ncbi:MAG TPA: methyltransferase [Sphingobacteriaceae bacterium]
METIQKNPSPGGPPPEVVLNQLIFGGLVQKCIWAIAKLTIPDLLKDHPKPVSRLASETGTDPGALYRVLRTLAAVGLFSESAGQTFGLAPMGRLLQSGSPGSMRDFAVMIGENWLWSDWAQILYTVKTGGIAHHKVHGMSTFEYFEQNKEAGEIFNRAMTNLSELAVPAILEAYDFSGTGKLVDVAGGHGFLLAAILQQYPGMQGMLFDLPFVIEGAPRELETMGVRDRVELVSGDFFTSVPQGGDCYLMKHIIHDWDDEQSTRILKNIGAAMNAGGKLLLVEMVVPGENIPHPSKTLDVLMMLVEGGMERTADQFRLLLKGAGFNMRRIISTRSPMSLIEAEPINAV